MALSGTLVIVLTLVFGVCAELVNYAAYPEDVREENSDTGNSLESPDASWQAHEGQIPYQLFIRALAKNGGITTCGGSIIHKEWGLTAAHCTALRRTLIIKAGAANLSNADVIIETNTWYNHPRFIEVLQRVVQPNDISLIKFGVVLEFSDNLKPIQLQRSFEKNRNYEDVKMITSGWGHTWTGILSRTVNITHSGMSCTNSQDNTTRTCTKERLYTSKAVAVHLKSQTPEYLNWAYMRGLSTEVCIEAYNYAVHIQESTLCAVFDEETAQSICLGDSGGPLTAEDGDGNPVLVGVTSFISGLGCHTGSAPFGFIRPGHYHEWFANVTGIDFDKEIWINNGDTDEETTETTSVTEESNNSTTDEPTTIEQTTEFSTDSSTLPTIEDTTGTALVTDESYPSTTEDLTTTESSTASNTSPAVEETTKTTLVTEESYPSTTVEATTTEKTTEFITDSNTSPVIDETTETTLATEEPYPGGTEEVTTTDHTTVVNTESSTFPIEETTGTTLVTEDSNTSTTDGTISTEETTSESSTSQPIVETTETTLFTEESNPTSPEEAITTELPTSISVFPTREPTTETSTSQAIEQTTTSQNSEEPNTSTTEHPRTDQSSFNNETFTTDPTSDSSTSQAIDETTTVSKEEFTTTEELSNETSTSVTANKYSTQFNEETTSSLFKEDTSPTTIEVPATTEQPNSSTPEGITHITDTTIPEISFTKPNFDVSPPPVVEIAEVISTPTVDIDKYIN